MSDAALPLRLPHPVAYAERGDEIDAALDRWGRRAAAPVTARLARLRAAGPARFLARASALAPGFEALSDAELDARLPALRESLRARTHPADEILAPALAHVREAAWRSLGRRPYDVQMQGARALLRGFVAEMRTGEGKTLVAALTAVVHALAGRPVHVVTANEYLAARDGEELAPLYARMGLSVGTIRPDEPPEARRRAYAADVVHASGKDLAFDYLRDRIHLRRRPGNLRRKAERLIGREAPDDLRMRGLHVAVVDEADSVMIDEARTPLIISGKGADPADLALFRHARAVAAALEERRDYRLSPRRDRVELTDRGRDLLDDLAETDEDAPRAFRVPVIREHAVVQALAADHVFRRDAHYIVREDKIAIVDEFTGRPQPDRTWSDGLHQMIELKEGLEPSPPHRTEARITFQRFFRRYDRLCGMTGTARDSAWEFWSVYRLPVDRIPTHRPDARRVDRPRVWRSGEARDRALAGEIARLQAEGRAVLLGVRSVAAAEAVSARLAALGAPHQVLSAAQDADEAEKIARAGVPGAVTVATAMAGRGTDIRLGPGVPETGGLHVIVAERHDSRRVDLQLAGRCGRQGDPGRVQTFLSLDDELLQGRAAAPARALASLALALLPGAVGERAAARLLRARQKAVEHAHAVMRRDLLETDKRLADMLALSGQME
ncbi:translocase [uncultured Albimonas sp.]|uniref:preprotein translocase subunit SecA n=1 Tax=uncultured Albimonas sp. TaxID=1331701 RepID=UPI0030EE20A3|tara:strand:+ start:3330 stop:5339 length:2010 start_codon:yes stop_codon:yes gene_type:complete